MDQKGAQLSFSAADDELTQTPTFDFNFNFK